MFTVEEPQEIIEMLKKYFDEQQFTAKEDEKKYKLNVRCVVQEEETEITVKVEKVEEGVHCIRMSKVVGNKMDSLKIFNEMKERLTAEKMLI